MVKEWQLFGLSGQIFVHPGSSFIPFTLYGQTLVDSFIEKLDNKNCEYEIGKSGQSKIGNNGNYKFQKIALYVTSIDADSLLKVLNKDTLIAKSISALNNVNKDWYANALLYDITKRSDAITFLVIKDRNAWIYSQKDKDVKYWNNTLRKIQW